MAAISQYASRVAEAIFVIQKLERIVTARTKRKEGSLLLSVPSPIPDRMMSTRGLDDQPGKLTGQSEPMIGQFVEPRLFPSKA
jgi:hypothetical protein